MINHVIDYNIWAVKADSPFKTVKDVVDAAKKKPETITVSAFGAGSDDHIAILGSRRRPAPSSSSSTARAPPRRRRRRSAAISRCSPPMSAKWRKRSGPAQFRLLGVMSPERSRFLPKAPTFKEQGFNQVWSVTRGIAAPAKLDTKAEATLTAALEKVHRVEGAPGEGGEAQPRAAGHQGRRVRQVPQGQRAGHQEADEVVMQSREIVVVHSSDVHVDHVYTAQIHGGDGAAASQRRSPRAKLDADVVLLRRHVRLPPPS